MDEAQARKAASHQHVMGTFSLTMSHLTQDAFVMVSSGMFVTRAADTGRQTKSRNFRPMSQRMSQQHRDSVSVIPHISPTKCNPQSTRSEWCPRKWMPSVAWTAFHDRGSRAVRHSGILPWQKPPIQQLQARRRGRGSVLLRFC